VIVVGGAGAMGRIAVRDLARSAGVRAVSVADVDLGGANEVARQAAAEGDVEVRGVAADVTTASLSEAIRGHDVCIASVAYRLNPLIARACLEAGCAYVDLGGLFHVALQTLEMDEEFRQAGLTGVTCMGGSPGITNMLAAVGARRLDEVHAVRVRLGAIDPSVESLPLPIPYSLETLLDEFSLPAMAWREGRFFEVRPLGEPEDVDFPAPVGRRTAYSTLHSEVATMARSFPGVREVTFKIAFEPSFVDKFRTLAAIGLASSEPLTVRGASVRPRDVLAELGRRLPQAEGIDDTECLRVEMDGVREGRPASMVAESVVRPDARWGVGGGGLDTGIPPSVVAQMIVAGEVRGPGMFAPEQAVDPDRFFERLAAKGIGYSITEQ
jgi:lysine 6-dehydrogenase